MTRQIVMVLGALAVLVVPAGPVAAQQDEPDTRREHLEALVLSGFLTRTAQETGMSDDQRTRVEEILVASAARHRERVAAGAVLRRELGQAVRSDATTAAEFERLLDRVERLRTDEHQAWQNDQRAIAEILTPRQRAAFAVRWIALQESIREMIGRRGGAQRRPR